MNDISINDKSKFFSEIFENFQKNQNIDEEKIFKFVSTEKWLEQLSRKITS